MNTFLQRPLIHSKNTVKPTVAPQKRKLAAKVQRKRSNHAAQSMRISVTISPQLAIYLRGLLKLGLYGTSISDVAERLICESLHGDTKRLRAAALAQGQK